MQSKPTQNMLFFNIHYNIILASVWGTRWRSWLRHCATSRKVATSITDSVTGTFHFGDIKALGSTQLLTEMSKDGRRVRLTTLPPLCADYLEILGASTSWKPQGLYRDSSTFAFYRLCICVLFPSVSPPKPCMYFSPMHATFSAHLILLDLLTLIISVEIYTL
jgi:hypothetical protein